MALFSESLLSAFTAFVSLFALANGHGMLIDPPGRSTAWRFGFNTTINYNDNELFCGGFAIQWFLNDGKCGVCGDAYHAERRNELPDGIFTRNLAVTRKYIRGSIITVTAQLTANHKGYFVFKLCPATTRSVEVTQECLDSHVLEVANSIDKYTYELPSDKSTNFSVELKLPDDIICERCVLQWDYVAGNNWGVCKNGTGRIGCGIQEMFRNCADIEITPHENDIDSVVPNFIRDDSSSTTLKPKHETHESTTVTLTKSTVPQPAFNKPKVKKETFWPKWKPRQKNAHTTLLPTFKQKQQTATSQTSPMPATSTPEVSSVFTSTHTSENDSKSSSKKCVAIGSFGEVSGMDSWCESMCLNTEVCPESHCYCHQHNIY